MRKHVRVKKQRENAEPARCCWVLCPSQPSWSLLCLLAVWLVFLNAVVLDRLALIKSVEQQHVNPVQTDTHELDESDNATHPRCYLPNRYPRGYLSKRRLVYSCRYIKQMNSRCEWTQKSGGDCLKCIPPFSDADQSGTAARFFAAEQSSREQRRSQLKRLFDEGVLSVKHGQHQTLTLVSLNSGYLHLFFNWLCLLKQERIADDIIDTTLVILTDGDPITLRLLADWGFRAVVAPTREWFPFPIRSEAAPSFGRGSHSWIVSLQIVYLSDVTSVLLRNQLDERGSYGFSHVLLQDIDVVWKRDPRMWLHRSMVANRVDLAGMADGRGDHRGPLNSGFVWSQVNCKSAVLSANLVRLLGVVFMGGSDQRLWNLLLNEYDFRQLNVLLLRPDLFINGNQFGNGMDQSTQLLCRDAHLAKQPMVVHNSWVSTHRFKVTKSKYLGYWVLNQHGQCPHMSIEHRVSVPEHLTPLFFCNESQRRWEWNPSQMDF